MQRFVQQHRTSCLQNADQSITRLDKEIRPQNVPTSYTNWSILLAASFMFRNSQPSD
jgi:hypothetical protein